MADGFAIAVVSVLLAALGIFLGFHAGEEAGGRCNGTPGYAAANLLALAAGSLAFMVVWATGYVVLGMLAVGAVAGAVAGLKFGYGESVGPWRFVDRLMTPRARALDRERARARRAARERGCSGAEEPELMSVAPGEGGGAQAPGGGARPAARGRSNRKGTK